MAVKGNSKEKILNAALDLFSEKGYEGVGVDEIAESVGMKGPSIYKHFKGKQDILDHLMSQVEIYYEQRMNTNNHQKKLESLQQLKQISLEQISFTINDERIIKVRKVLTLEQYRNKRISELASLHSLDALENVYKVVFSQMINDGLLKGDANQLAFEYIAPVTVLIQKSDRHPEKKEEILRRIENHLQHFIDTYGC